MFGYILPDFRILPIRQLGVTRELLLRQVDAEHQNMCLSSDEYDLTTRELEL